MSSCLEPSSCYPKMEGLTINSIERILKFDNQWLKIRVESLKEQVVTKDQLSDFLQSSLTAELWLIAHIPEEYGVVKERQPALSPRLLERPLPESIYELGVQYGLLDAITSPFESRNAACSLVYTRRCLTASVVKCAYCGRNGHQEERCFFNQEGTNCRPHLVERKCRFCCGKGHEEIECFFNPDGANYRPASAKKRRGRRRGKRGGGGRSNHHYDPAGWE